MNRDYDKADIPLVHDDMDLVCCDCFCIMSCNQIGWETCLDDDVERSNCKSREEYLNEKFKECLEEEE